MACSKLLFLTNSRTFTIEDFFIWLRQKDKLADNKKILKNQKNVFGLLQNLKTEKKTLAFGTIGKHRHCIPNNMKNDGI